MSDGHTIDELVTMFRMEELAFQKQQPELQSMLDEHQKAAYSMLKEVKELEAKKEDLDKELRLIRTTIGRKRGKDTSDKQMSAEETKKELQKGVAGAVPVFVQALCRYNSEDAKKPSKLKFWKKDVDVDQVRLLSLSLDLPNGARGPCQAPASGFSFVLNCHEPTESLEDMAEKGGSVELVFNLRKPDGKTEELIQSAQRYFEEYFASRAKSEGALPEVEIKTTTTTLVVRGKLSMERKRVGGFLGKMQEMATGEFLAAQEVARAEGMVPDPSPSPTPDGRGSPASEAGTPQASSDASNPRHPILGRHSEEEAKEALKLLHHTRLSCSFASSQDYSSLLENGKLNWDFFDEVTASGELVLERAVYKAVQKVVDIFSGLAAAKMSVGGKIFKKLNFKVDGLLFRALREDPELQAEVEKTIEKAMGQSVGLTDEIMEHLEVLERSLSGIKSMTLMLPAATASLQLQGLDFFSIVASAARVHLSRIRGADT